MDYAGHSPGVRAKANAPMANPVHYSKLSNTDIAKQLIVKNHNCIITPVTSIHVSTVACSEVPVAMITAYIIII